MSMPSAGNSYQGCLSMPWKLDELALVGGVPCCYSKSGDEWLYHLPGGKRLTATEIMRAGMSFQFPFKLRTQLLVHPPAKRYKVE